MKVFLILPPLTYSGNDGLLPRFAPYITASVAAHLQKENFKVMILDAYLENCSFSDVLRQVNIFDPEIIGIPLTEINREVPLESSLAMAQYLKANNQKSFIIGFGSKDIELIQRYFEKNNGMDYYIAGDPEETIVDLVKLLSKNNGFDNFGIKGLLYRNKKELIFSGERILLDIDRLEFPAWDMVNLNRYAPVPHRYKNIKFYPLTSTRGCRWNKCIFCQDQACITKYSPYRVKSPRRIVEEIIYASKKYDCREIQFYDQHFNTDKDWLLQLESEFKRNRIDINWSCLARVDLVNPEVLNIMHRMGCWNILFGIEAVNARLLKIMNKGIIPEQIESAVGWCKKEGIEVTGSFLIGIPEERPGDVFDAVNFARRIGIDYIQLFIAKWAKEHDGFENSGRLTDFWDFPDHDFSGRVFIPKGYRNLRHLKNVQRLAYLRFYLHPKTVLKHLKKINSRQDIKRLIEALRTLLRLFKNKNRFIHTEFIQEGRFKI